MGENFKFQIQDIFLFLNIFWGEIGRFEKQIALSEKKPPLTLICFTQIPLKILG